MKRILALMLSVHLLGCPDTGGEGPGSGGGAGGSGSGSGGSQRPVPLVFTSRQGASLHLEQLQSGLDFFACGITNDAHVHCWGTNNAGQLGYPDTGKPGSAPPRPVDLGKDYLKNDHAAKALSVGTSAPS